MASSRADPNAHKVSLARDDGHGVSYPEARMAELYVQDDVRACIDLIDLPKVRFAFVKYLRVREQQIAIVAAEHVGAVCAEDVQLAASEDWIYGRSTLCVPFTTVVGKNPLHGLVRFPFPDTRDAEAYPTSIDERVRCEAGTHIWMKMTCPDVSVPKVYGFGFPGGSSFTVMNNIESSDGAQPVFRRYNRNDVLPKIGYTVVSYVLKGDEFDDDDASPTGVLLSTVWDDHRNDPVRRANLLGDLVNIMLKMAQPEHTHIGSLFVDDNGEVTLNNRPFTRGLGVGEHAGIPSDIPRDQTYTCVDAYVLDLIQGCHDNRILHYTKAVRNIDDGQLQVAALTMMRSLLPHFMNPRLRDGPFALMMTDLDMGGIVVDPTTWHLKTLLNLGWPCVRPLEMLQPPLWLGNAAGTTIAKLVQDDASFQRYTAIHQEYTNAILAASEALGGTPESGEVAKLAHLLEDALVTGRFWYVLALDHPAVLHSIFVQRIQPLFTQDLDDDDEEDDRQFRFADAVAPYWRRNAVQLLESKVADRLAQDGGHLYWRFTQTGQRGMTREYARMFLRLHTPQIIKMCTLHGDELMDVINMAMASFQPQLGSTVPFGMLDVRDDSDVADSIETNGSHTDSVAANELSNDDDYVDDDDEDMYDEEDEEDDSSSEDEKMEDDENDEDTEDTDQVEE
ncbi:hypothetical protein SEUCBS139899_004094 [Sporothrix eucalyptigena]